MKRIVSTLATATVAATGSLTTAKDEPGVATELEKEKFDFDFNREWQLEFKSQPVTWRRQSSQGSRGSPVAERRAIPLSVLALVLLTTAVAGTQERHPAAVVGGVRLEVRPDIAHPRPLSRPLVALFVIIENGGAADLAMRPPPFAIVSASGRTYRPIAPDALRRSPESSPFAEPAIALSALPEDLLARGARTEGFIYFEEIEESPPWTLTFTPSTVSGTDTVGVISVKLPGR